MRILITGVCGFVGSTLARGLRKNFPDWQIVGLDNFIRRGSEMNLVPLRRIGVKVVRGDLRNPRDLRALPGCDWVIDAAANPSVLAGVDGKTSSRELLDHNLIGTINLLEQIKVWESGLILLSTSRVYSLNELSSLPMKKVGARFEPNIRGRGKTIAGLSERGVAEDFSTQPPLSLYGTSKLASEILALEYASAFQFPVFINRCGVLAGAGQFGKIDQGIFSFWIHSYCRKRPLKYIGFDGTGSQVRDCLHAQDLLPLISAQIRKPLTGAPRIINVSGRTKNSASLRELSDWCAARFGNAKIQSEKKNRPFDVPWLVLDSRLAEKVWGWKPQTSLEQTWSEIAEHAEKNPHWLDRSSDS